MRNDLGGRKKVSVNSYNYIPLGFVKKLDDVTLKLNLINKNGLEFDVTGQTLSLRCKKANKQTEELSNTNTDTPIIINGNEIDIKLRNSMLSIPGTVNFELNISDNTGALTTASFFIIVSSTELDDNSIISSNQYSILQQLINNYNSLIDTDTTAEVVNARGVYSNLNLRLDSLMPKNDKLTSLTVSSINAPARGIGLYFTEYTDTKVTQLVELTKTYYELGFDSIIIYFDHKILTDSTIDMDVVNTKIEKLKSYLSKIKPLLFKQTVLRMSGGNTVLSDMDGYFSTLESIMKTTLNNIDYTFDIITISNEAPNLTSSYQTNWETLINNLKAITSSKIGISATGAELINCCFLDKLDVFGITQYPSLCYSENIKNERFEDLKNNFIFNSVIEECIELSKKYNKPLIITEVGNTPYQYSYMTPGVWQFNGNYDSYSQFIFWKVALNVLDNLSDLSGYYMFEGNAGYSPLSNNSDPKLKDYIKDYFSKRRNLKW